MIQETNFRFNKNNDLKKNTYLNCYSNIDTDTIIALNGTNFELKGIQKIVVREGGSKFGNQLLFQFLVKEKINEYKSNSIYPTIEFYLPLDVGVEFLEQSLKYIKDKLEVKP